MMCIMKRLFPVLLLLSESSWAFWSPAQLVPPVPVVGQSLSFQITARCEHILNFATPPVVEIDGSVIRVLLHGIEGIACIYPSITSQVLLPSLQSGQYTLVVSSLWNDERTDVLSTVPFSVAPAATPIPTSPLSLVTLCALLTAAGTWSILKQRRKEAKK